MRARVTIAGLAAAFLAGACSELPTNPSPGAALSAGLGTEAKHGGGGPSPSAHTLAFTDPRSGNGLGFVSASGQAVSGWITGPNATGYFKASAVAGSYSMSLTGVGPNPSPDASGNPCTPEEQSLLAGLGLVGGSVSGALSLTVDEDTKGSVQGPTMVWELSGIDVGDGSTWTIVGGSGSTDTSTFPQFGPGSTNESLTVSVENGRAHFYRYPGGTGGRGKKPSHDLFIACRVNLKMTMVKP